jgi:hypothetical protein
MTPRTIPNGSTIDAVTKPGPALDRPQLHAEGQQRLELARMLPTSTRRAPSGRWPGDAAGTGLAFGAQRRLASWQLRAQRG